MADAAVSFLVDNLQQLILAEADLLIGLEEKIGWIETEFRVMVAYLESIDALRQIPDQKAMDWLEKTRSVIRRTEGLIETYAKRAAESRAAALYRKPSYWIEKRNLSKELDNIKDEIIRVRQGWRSVDLNTSTSTSTSSSSSRAMAKLDSALQQVVGQVPALMDGIKWVRGELAPLHHFLQQVDHYDDVLVLGERQKIWIQELRDVFRFVDQSLDGDESLSLSSCWNSLSDQGKLGQVVRETQDKILQLYRRYHAYGFGEILVNNNNNNDDDNGSSIFPRIRMTTPMPDVSVAPDSVATGFLIKLLSFLGLQTARNEHIHRRMSYSSWLTPKVSMQSLRVELQLMKALLEDTSSMNDLDERVKVWLNQMKELCIDLDALQNEHQGKRKGVFYNVKNALNLRRIGYEIRDSSSRKLTYGIGNALGENGLLDSIAAVSFGDPSYKGIVISQNIDEMAGSLEEAALSKNKLRRQVKSVGKELEIVQALLQDVSRMEKLDTRLKLWVEEMQRLAREAKAVMELDTNNIYKRFQASRSIKRINKHILIIARWKNTYDIGDIKPRRHAAISGPNLDERAPYPSNAMEGRLELLRKEVKLIQDLDVEIDNLDGTSQAWMEEMRNVAEDANNLILPTNTISKFPKIFSTRDIKLDKDLTRVQEKIAQLSEIRVAYGIEFGRKKLPPHIVSQIKAKLLVDHEGTPVIIPILGMKHAHKEVLQDIISDDDSITHHFDWHAWVHVAEEFRASSISESMAMQIMEQYKSQFLEEELKLVSENPTKDELMELLQDLLTRKRCLIVLDEIHTVEVWQYLNEAFQKISTGSKIILMSNKHTCSLLNSTPNAIFDGPIILQGGDVTPSLDASNTVPSYLRQCLYYFILFPANFEVPARRLIALWVAEGLVHSKKNGNESAEHIADRYLEELIHQGMVHVTKKKLNGKVKACQLNDEFRDTWLNTAKEARFFQDTTGNTTRLIDHHHGTNDDPCFIQIHGNPNSSASVKNYQNVLSFLSFDTQEGSKPGEDIGDFLNKCILAGCFLWLRVLDLERVFRPKLPKSITRLTQLRYLGLRWTYLEDLPKYVSMLFNLQVIDVKHTYIGILPKSIWTMQYLRHLYLSETYRTKFAKRPSKISLNELQTLWGAFIDENTSVKDGLDNSLDIRKLGLSCRSTTSTEPDRMSEQLRAVAQWILKLEFLETLRLKSRDERGKASDLHLNTLETNTNLSTVYLLGKLRPSVVTTFPENLIEITLSGSELKGDRMEYLGKLKKLVVLRLLSRSLLQNTMHCSQGSFPKLKVLKVWGLENLEIWEGEEGALPCLEDLEIRACKNLKMLPQALQQVDTLQKFRLTQMPQRFVNDSKAMQPMIWAKIEDVLEVVEEQQS